MKLNYSPLLRLRLTAYFIDLFVILIFAIGTLVAVVAAYGYLRFAGDEALIKSMLASPETKAFAQISHAAILFAYFTLSHWYFGRTLGKRAMGLEVSTHGHGISLWRSSLRSFGYFLSGSLTFGLGFAFPLFRKDGRALHDLLAGTDVTYSMKSVKEERPSFDQVA